MKGKWNQLDFAIGSARQVAEGRYQIARRERKLKKGNKEEGRRKAVRR
jgi:hypothetical protein